MRFCSIELGNRHNAAQDDTMPVTADRPAPYTSPKVILDLIERHRSRGLPTPVNAETLARAGVPDSLLGRTMQSLTGLDLVDDQGKPSPALEAIRLAPQSEYTARIADWLNSVYADVLQYVDPATSDDTAIRDAFRNYQPVGQQDRMVTLFLGLFRAAGVAPEKAQAAPRPVKNKAAALYSAARTARPTAPRAAPKASFTTFTPAGGVPAPLAGLLASLPAVGWTQADRDKFILAFGAVLDFVVPVREAAAASGGDDDQE
jgi:hypothetical protein